MLLKLIFNNDLDSRFTLKTSKNYSIAFLHVGMLTMIKQRILGDSPIAIATMTVMLYKT